MDDLQRKAVATLWKRGNLNFLLHEGQIKAAEVIKNTDSQLQVILCSRQWGKTFLLVCAAISFCLKNEKQVVKYGAAFLTDLNEFVIPAFNKILSTCPESLKPEYKASKNKYIFQNGSEIHLIGLDKNPNKIRGASLGMVVLDEAAFASKLRYIFDNVIMPATTHFPDCKIIMGSTPPMSPDHDFVEFINEAKQKNTISHYTIDDNPLISEANKNRLIEAAGGRNSSTARKEYFCEVIIDETLAIIPEFDKERHVKQILRDDYFQYYLKYTSQDMSGGANDKHVILSAFYDFQEAKLKVLGERIIEPHDVTSESIAAATFELESEVFDKHKIKKRISDNNNIPMLRDLSSIHKCSYIPVKKDNSKEAMVSRLRLAFQNDQIEIDPKCEFLIGSLETCLWNNKRSEFARSKTYGHADAIDALIYMLISINKQKNPIPSHHNTKFRKTVLPQKSRNKTKNQAAAKLLKELFNV